MPNEGDSKRPAQRGPYKKTAKRRADILDAAISVFSESGFESGSLKEIAARAGLTEAGLLYHFETKSDLLNVVLMHRGSTTPLPESDTEAGERLREVVKIFIRNHAAEPLSFDTVMLMEASLPSHPAHGYFVEQNRALRSLLVRIFRDLRSQGRLVGDSDVDDLAVTTVALLNGLRQQLALQPHGVDVERALASFFEVLIRGYSSSSAAQPHDLS